MHRESRINLVSFIILAGFVLSVFFHYIKGSYLGLPYPHDTFLFIPGDRFMDFFSLLDWNKNLNPYLQQFASPQYPLLSFICYLLSVMPYFTAFVIFNVLIVACFVYFNAESLYANGSRMPITSVFVFSFLTYPFLFTIDRGNFESLLCIFLLFFIFFYKRGKMKTASLFLSFAISMKLFPVVLLVLLLSDKKYKEAVLTVCFTAIVTLACLMTFKGGLYNNLTVLLMGSNVSDNPLLSSYLGNNNFVQRGVTLFTFSKLMFLKFDLIKNIDMAQFLKIYSKVMIALFLLLAGYVALVEKELWKKATLLVFAMLLFPHISADYKLLHIFIPLLLFINSGRKSGADWFYAVMFALLLIPKNYYLLPNIYSDSGASDISIAVILNPLLMMGMMSVIIVSGLKETDISEIKGNLIAHVDAIKRVFRPAPVTM